MNDENISSSSKLSPSVTEGDRDTHTHTYKRKKVLKWNRNRKKSIGILHILHVKADRKRTAIHNHLLSYSDTHGAIPKIENRQLRDVFAHGRLKLQIRNSALYVNSTSATRDSQSNSIRACSGGMDGWLSYQHLSLPDSQLKWTRAANCFLSILC